MLSEQYKNFPESYFSDTYKVSNFGNIKNSKTNILLKTNIFKNYICIRIDNKFFRVDKLVAECFIDKSDLYLVHIDGDKTNNMVSNLLFKNTNDYLKDLYGDEWKQIKEFNDYYISSTGKVWSLFSERMLTFSLSYGYYRVNLGGKKNSKKKHVHRLVAEAFIDNINNYPVVNHKNGVKTDCSVNNLEWVTHSENSLHSIYELGNTNIDTRSTAICEMPTDYLPLTINDNYLITKDGQIYSKTNKKYLVQHLRQDGYMSVSINDKAHKVHRLVASTFLPSPSNDKIFVNHKNLNRSDNSIDNLEWVSPSENTKHQVDSNPDRYLNQQKKVACLDKDTEEVINIYNSLAEAAKDKGIKSSGNISNVCRGNAKSTGGYKWKYIE